MFGFRKAIDNSAKTVAERLNYLRFIDHREIGHPTGCREEVSEDVLKLPRKIDYDVQGFMYKLCYAYYDSHYHLSEAAKRDIADRRTRPLKKYGEPYKDIDYVIDSYYHSRENHAGLFPINSAIEWGDNLVITPTFVATETRADFQIPEELEDLGISGNDWDRLFDNSLDCYYWENGGTSDRTLDAPVTGFGITYALRLEPVINVYVNNTKVSKYNLTITEQELILEKIRSGELQGWLSSTGAEEAKYITGANPADIGDGINSLQFYGERDPAEYYTTTTKVFGKGR